MIALAAVRFSGFHSSLCARLVFSGDKRDVLTQREFATLATLYRVTL